MMRTAQDRLEGHLKFLRQITVLQKLPEPKEHVLAKISELIKVVSFLITFVQNIKYVSLI